jgi:outer membrane protein assembly factor BamE (lipoprotein component of BamABCDE complex)
MLSGCASARHGASSDFISQWQTIHAGMTAQEVRTRLGKPYTSYIPTDDTNRIEYWLFTHTDWAFVPPPEAYVIYYNRSGRVSSSFSPQTQPK